MFRFAPRAALAALVLSTATASGAGAATAAGSPPVAQAAAACKVPADGRGWGPTYVTMLRVQGTGCSTGKALVKAYFRCRKADGGVKGTCERKVDGFRCTEKRGAAIPTQFDATVTCRKGGARVVHAYTQFT